MGQLIALVLGLRGSWVCHSASFLHSHYWVRFLELPWLAHPMQPAASGRASSLDFRSLDPGCPRSHNQGQLYCFVQVRCRALSPSCCRGSVRRKWWDQLSCSPTLRTGSPAHPTTESAPVCCPDGVQGRLSCVMQLVRGRVSSGTLMTLGPALSPVSGSKGQRGKSIFRLLMPPPGRQGGVAADKDGWHPLCCSQAVGAGSPASLTTGSTLVCCPNGVHGPLQESLFDGGMPAKTLE